eukprot:TRINITY_DN4965_c0_g1_i13.p1 TRINITY_DN4965_c0_g1~~TRINITY_DN4965_c0_g1_i13.p1  ORF type:complete len:160 (+),score=8.66 TRINITY_DN4965_c0_g1_i13:120-599(+)
MPSQPLRSRAWREPHSLSPDTSLIKLACRTLSAFVASPNNDPSTSSPSTPISRIRNTACPVAHDYTARCSSHGLTRHAHRHIPDPQRPARRHQVHHAHRRDHVFRVSLSVVLDQHLRHAPHEVRPDHALEAVSIPNVRPSPVLCVDTCLLYTSPSPRDS